MRTPLTEFLEGFREALMHRFFTDSTVSFGFNRLIFKQSEGAVMVFF